MRNVHSHAHGPLEHVLSDAVFNASSQSHTHAPTSTHHVLVASAPGAPRSDSQASQVSRASQHTPLYSPQIPSDTYGVSDQTLSHQETEVSPPPPIQMGQVPNGSNESNLCFCIPPTLISKAVFVISVASVILISISLVCYQSILLYYYVILTPILILTRIIQYWKLKWQLFLVDLCYFGNLMMNIYIWSLTSSTRTFAVLFSLANGPMMWAVFFFRNSLVFHNIDKMTSAFIHLIPAYLTYCIRWFPSATSRYWISNFALEQLPVPNFFWLFVIPFLIYLLHCTLYIVIVHVIIKPHTTYLDSFRYIRSKQESIFYKIIDMCGEKYHLLVFHLCSTTFAIVSMLLSIIFYANMLAHILYLALLTTICIINGSGYYIDVYRMNRNTGNNNITNDNDENNELGDPES